MGIEEIRTRGVVAVIRGASASNIIPIVDALTSGGVSAIEITMESPRALSALEAVAQQLNEEVFVGAGTVLDAETARAAIMSGAKFIFSPTVKKETITMAKRYGIISVPGAFTPTEILSAYELGADIVKLFPAGTVGPGYLKAIAGPLPQIPLMPTGGIDIGNVRSYIEAGAIAVGVGSTLVDASKELTDEYLHDVSKKASLFMEQVEKARGMLV